MSTEYKQVIVMRTMYPDEKGGIFSPRKGKMIAQGSHSTLAFLTRRMKAVGNRKYEVTLSEAEEQWLNSSYAKICVRVDSEAQLLEIRRKAEEAGLEVHLVTDSGLTEFGQPTNTCLAIGPDRSDKIDAITGSLKLL